MRTALAVAATLVAVATAMTTVAMTAIAVVATRTTAVGTRTIAALLFLIAIRLGEQGAVRQAQLAGLLVDFDELHIDLVAFLQAGLFHALVAFPVNLGDME